MERARENGIGTLLMFGILGLGLAGGLGYYLYSRNAASGGDAAAGKLTPEKASMVALAQCKKENGDWAPDQDDYEVKSTELVPSSDPGGPPTYKVVIAVMGSLRSYAVDDSGATRLAATNPRYSANLLPLSRIPVRTRR